MGASVKISLQSAAEMAQELKTLAALPEDGVQPEAPT